MRLFFSVLILLFYDVFCSEIVVNSNRKYLFGDVLEPLCSVITSDQSLSKSDVIQLFHQWETYTSSQIATSSSSVSDYRKAMPCFPGPDLNLTPSQEDMIPPYPNCDVFVNISTSTVEEVEDLLQEIKKENSAQQMDVSLKSVINSLSNRLQNLIDYLPEGETKEKTQNYLSAIKKISIQPLRDINYSSPFPSFSLRTHKFNPSDLLSCFNISSFSPMDLLSLSGQTIGSVACSRFQICSYSSLLSNPCLSSLNISENQYNSVVNKTIGDVIGQKLRGFTSGSNIGKFFGELTRSKRTPDPLEYEEVTPLMKMDGREEESEEGVMDEQGNSTDTAELIDQMNSEERLDVSREKEKLHREPTSQFEDLERLPSWVGSVKFLEEGSGLEDVSDSRVNKKVIDEVINYTRSPEDVKRTLDGYERDGSGEYPDKQELETIDSLLKSEESHDVIRPSFKIPHSDGIVSSRTRETEKIKDNSLYSTRIPLGDKKNSEDVKRLLKLDAYERDGSGEQPSEEISSKNNESEEENSRASPKVRHEVIRPFSRIQHDVTHPTKTSESIRLQASTESIPYSRNQGDVNFDEALSYFKTQIIQDDDVISQNLTNIDPSLLLEVQQFLNTNLNSSMVENLSNGTPIQQNVTEILSELGDEFTISDILNKLKIYDWSTLKQLFGSFDVLNIIGKLSSIGINLESLQKIVDSSSGNSMTSLVDKVKAKLSSTDSSKSPELSKIVQKLSESSTIPTVLQNALKSNDTSSLISDALSVLKSNSSHLSKLNL
ncbi:hypothetical protein GCK72_010761 [Caenorhabditis remanei]|uniref:Domain of unknown function WSN domain-containing protein n=1 Tax=Caenorhabditis remanei TaxID=31234 RepID=A0A6A5H627_CAERE|nr:hypothetical protein GCK72_010761 [Caenorhabditis remanei]KAF1762499.1 hypothetical protein GCK72_010761 [Caenorhabditis remanei]